MKRARVLITGIAGLLGSRFAKYLINQGYEVVGIDDLSGGLATNVPDEALAFQDNICDFKTLDQIFESTKPDFVAHFAADAAEIYSPFARIHNYTNNLIGSASVINCCVNHKVRHLIFMSSIARYGDIALPYVEEDRPRPKDCYGIAKYAVELDLQEAYEHFGLKYTVFAPHNVIGVGQNIYDPKRNAIGIWINQAINGKNLTIYGDGLQTRAFSDVEFCLPTFESAFFLPEMNNQLFNIGADQPITILKACEVVRDAAISRGLNPSIDHLEARREVKHAYSDHSKVSVYGYKDETDFEKTVNDMFDWALTLPKQPSFDTRVLEITKNVPSYWQPKEKNPIMSESGFPIGAC